GLRELPLERGVHDDRPGLADLDAAGLPHRLEEVEHGLLGQLVRGLGVRGDRLEQAAGPTDLTTQLRLRRRARVGARDERLLDVAGDLLELLRELPRELVGRDGRRAELDRRAPRTALAGRGLLGVRDLDGLLVDLDDVRLCAARATGRGR